MAAPSPYVFDTGVTLVGGARYNVADLEHAKKYAPVIISADTRIDDPLILPDIIIGDMDSSFSYSNVPVIKLDEQETTDFEKCLYTTKAPFYIGIGLLGQRFDHTLAACHILIKYAEKNIFLVGDTDVVFSLGVNFFLNIPKRTRFSIFPISPVYCLAETGLEWSISQTHLHAGQLISTSNITNEDCVKCRFNHTGAIGILPKEFLKNLIQAYV